MKTCLPRLALVAVMIARTLSVQVTTGSDKPFRRARACNGSDVCATDEPSVGFTIVPDSSKKRQLPPVIRCLSYCKAEQSCTGANFRNNQCELFFFQPENFEIQPDCRYYEVNNKTVKIVIFNRVLFIATSITGFAGLI